MKRPHWDLHRSTLGSFGINQVLQASGKACESPREPSPSSYTRSNSCLWLFLTPPPTLLQESRTEAPVDPEPTCSGTDIGLKSSSDLQVIIPAEVSMGRTAGAKEDQNLGPG